LAPKENIQAIIAIKILRDGTLDYASFEKHSGNRYFDDAALKAVKKSVPFAPFPEKIRENSIEIGIIFHPSQLR
jgi:TonB family protein